MQTHTRSPPPRRERRNASTPPRPRRSRARRRRAAASWSPLTRGGRRQTAANRAPGWIREGAGVPAAAKHAVPLYPQGEAVLRNWKRRSKRKFGFAGPSLIGVVGDGLFEATRSPGRHERVRNVMQRLLQATWRLGKCGRRRHDIAARLRKTGCRPRVYAGLVAAEDRESELDVVSRNETLRRGSMGKRAGAPKAGAPRETHRGGGAAQSPAATRSADGCKGAGEGAPHAPNRQRRQAARSQPRKSARAGTENAAQSAHVRKTPARRTDSRIRFTRIRLQSVFTLNAIETAVRFVVGSAGIKVAR